MNRTAVLAVPAAALALIAGLSFDGAFALGTIWPMCVACAAIPAAIVAVAGLRRRPARGFGHLPLPVTASLWLGAWAAVMPALARALAASGAGSGWLGLLRAAVTDAPRQLLTIVPPAPADPVLLAGLGTLVWWAAGWSAEAALRSRSALLAAFPPALVLLAGTAAGVPRGSASQLWPAAAFVAVLACQFAVHRSVGGAPGRGMVPQGRRLGAAVGRGLAAAVTALAVPVVALVCVPILPGLASRPPADPRALLRPPSHTRAVLDPLSLVSAWVSGPPRSLFTVHAAVPVNVRWLVLDRYDGQQWTSDAQYLPAGTALPGAPGVASLRITESVQVTGLPGIWLPAADRPVSIAGAAVRFDPASSMLATLDGEPVTGLSYQITSDVPQPSLSQLENAVPGFGAALAAQRTLPAGLSAAVAGFGTQAMAGAISPYQQLLLLQQRLLGDFRYDPHAPPGESYGSLWYFVTKHRVGGQGAFATLFAVLARRAGYASRIAIGFLPGRRLAPGVYQVTTADALVWPEVYFTGLGWVPFYPLPEPRSAHSASAVRPLGQPGRIRGLNQKVSRSHPRGLGQPRPVVPRAGRATGTGALAVVVAVAGLVLAGGVGYLAFAAIARARVRRRGGGGRIRGRGWPEPGRMR
jgi:transglutaminase-like putative cysteine protease